MKVADTRLWFAIVVKSVARSKSPISDIHTETDIETQIVIYSAAEHEFTNRADLQGIVEVYTLNPLSFLNVN